MKLLIDSRFSDHPRVLGTSGDAIKLWVQCGCWLARYPNQGERIPKEAVRFFAGTEEAAEELVRVGLWKRAKGGYRMPRDIPAINGMQPTPLWDTARDDYRRKIPDSVRRRVMERDGYRCVKCGSTEDLSLDHIYPWSRGGRDAEDNLRVLCRSCNSSKGAQV